MKTYNYLYQITNKLNGKIYIGIHSTNNLNDGYMGSGKIIKTAIYKYGITNFNKTIIAYANSRDELFELEKQYVNKEFLKRNDVYNLALGGSGRRGELRHPKSSNKYAIHHSYTKRKQYKIYHFNYDDFCDILPDMKLNEAYETWKTISIPRIKQHTYLLVKEPNKLAFRKMLDKNNIQYKQKKH